MLPVITTVRGYGSGVWCWQASRYFLTYVASGYFWFIRGCVLTSGVGSWSSGSRTSLDRKFLPVFLLPVGILLLVCILLPVLRSYFGLPALVIWLLWRRTVLHRDGSRRVLERFPGAPERNPTCRIGRSNLCYGLDLAIIQKLLT